NGIATKVSTAFNVAAGTATQLVFTVQPSAATAGAAITPPVQVTAEDALGNTDPTFTGNVTVALGANPGGGALSGTTTVTAVSGVATLASLSVNKVGTGYTLTAAATGLPTQPSAGFRSESTRLNSSHVSTSYAVFCLKKKSTAPRNHLPNNIVLR